VTMYVGLNVGGWMTNGSDEVMAKETCHYGGRAFGTHDSYAASSPVLGENSDSKISAKIRQISVADRMPASFS
jgi:hypothetical protein